MDTHQQIDQRSLKLAQAVAERIDAEVALLEKAREWAASQESRAVREWLPILKQPWPKVREVLLSGDERGARLRQSSPFVGILSPRERWAIYSEDCS